MVVVDELSPDAIAKSHSVAIEVEVLEGEEVVAELGGVESGTATFDANSNIRGSLDLTIVDPDLTPKERTDLLTPFGNEIRVARGVDDELIRCGVYRIERATADSTEAGEMVRISGLDRAAWVEDDTFTAIHNVASGTQAADAIQSIVQHSLPAVGFDFVEDLDVPLPAVVAEEGDSRWTFVQGIATAIGCELFFDDEGILVLRPVPTIGQGTPVSATIAEGVGGVLLGATRDWDRGPVYNHVTVTGESSTDDTPVVRGVAIDDNENSPTYAFGKFGFKPFRYSSPYITDNAQAEMAAAAILARFIGAPDVVTFKSIVDPARRPSDVVRITREALGIDEDHILDRVDIPLDVAGELTAETRAAQELSGG